MSSSSGSTGSNIRKHRPSRASRRGGAADAHAHPRPHPEGGRELLLAFAITVVVMVIELVAGVASHSLALLADAGHMITDASVLALSFFASWIATRPATPEKTYGYYRTEILAALVNGIVLSLLVVWIIGRAIVRLHQPVAVDTGPMLIATSIGLIANIGSSLILSPATHANLNVRGAWLHVLSDMLGSVSALTAGLLIRFKGWLFADSLASIAIGLLIAVGAWSLVRQSVHVLLEGAPAHVSIPTIVEAMRQVPGVCDVHDVHVWTITTGLEAMSGHVMVEHLSNGATILSSLNKLLDERFRITHTTLQLEPMSHRCEWGH